MHVFIRLTGRQPIILTIGAHTPSCDIPFKLQSTQSYPIVPNRTQSCIPGWGEAVDIVCSTKLHTMLIEFEGKKRIATG